MAYRDFSKKLIEHVNNVASYLKGDGSITTIDSQILPTLELNAIQNATSAKQVISLSNAYYDQLAYKRTLTEIYKTPKQYYQDYRKMLEEEVKTLQQQADDVDDQHKSVTKTLETAKTVRQISPKLQAKLSMLK